MPADGDISGGVPAQPRILEPHELETLFARNLPRVRAFVRLRIDPVTRERESISDIVQSACREVLADTAFEFRDEASFRSYLCHAALHKLRNRRRYHLAERRSPSHEARAGDGALEQVYRTTLCDPGRAAMHDEEVGQLERAFDLLPDDYREALTLYRIAGMSVPDLARRMDRSEGAVKMLLHRAMARLSTLLAPPGDG